MGTGEFVYRLKYSSLQPSAFSLLIGLSRFLMARNVALNNLEVFGVSKNDWKMSCTMVL